MNNKNQKKKEETPGTDEKIKIDACDALAQVPDLSCSEIKISVDKGDLTLEGAVETPPLKEMAEESLQYVHGVGQVQNELHVDGHRHPKTSQLRQAQRSSPEEKQRTGRSK